MRGFGAFGVVAGALSLFAASCGGNPELEIGLPEVPDVGVTLPDGGVWNNPIITLPDAGTSADVSTGITRDVSCAEAITCATATRRCSGVIGNGCGGMLDCGACPAGESCGAHTPNVCGTPLDGCVPVTCAQVGGTYCGKIGDGCGRLLDCGDCSNPLACGGGGINHVCGASQDSGACNATSCTPPGGTYCGVVGDNCGGRIDCGMCPAGKSCGTDGIPNLCATDNCTKTSCTQPNGGKYCGEVGDGCGGRGGLRRLRQRTDVRRSWNCRRVRCGAGLGPLYADAVPTGERQVLRARWR